MADEEKKPNKSIDVTKPKEKKQDKAIDVTKPKEKHTPPPMSNIDATRVSAYTLQEQAALERLKKKVGHLNQKDSKASSIKSIIAIILVVILIALAIIFMIMLNRGNQEVIPDTDMKLSMQIENKSSLSIITEAGVQQLREINPGDKVPLRATVSNSDDMSIPDGSEDPPQIYVRFRLVLILDYQERYDIMIPTMSDKWYRYDAEIENKFHNGVKEDDHYYYYKGTLDYLEREELFSEIEFSGDAITCDDGGKYGQIQVHVESIEANISTIIDRSLWKTAPQGWIAEMLNSWV